MADCARVSVVLGAGPVGRALVGALHARGTRVRVVTRSGRAQVPAGVDTIAADISDADAARRACAGAGLI
jgi:nucleoside-diphosphate-sugar epimerase